MTGPAEPGRPHDLGDLFNFLLDENLGVAGLLQRFLDYHGRFYFGHQMLLFERLRDAIRRSGQGGAESLGVRDVMLADYRINPAFLERYAPELRDAYFAEAPLDRFAVTRLFGPSPNEWCDTSLPPPFNMRLGQRERPGLALLRGRASHLFVSPHGCQLFDPAAGLCWPAASSRAFGRRVASYPQIAVAAPVAILQDEYEATNLSHFLYDYIPRILYIADVFPDLARRCLFLVGGEPQAFHKLLLDRVCAARQLRAEQFVFPKASEVWRLSDEVVFSTDQRINFLHPLHMCQPLTLAMVRGLLSPGKSPQDTPERLFISRADAGMRKLINEDDLVSALRKQQFVAVRMSELDAAKQIATLMNARHIVAPHGMGLAPLVFNNGGGSLVEIFNERVGSDAYAFIAKALGISYRFSLGANKDEGNLNYEADVAAVTSLAAELQKGGSQA